GHGVLATVNGHRVAVGNSRLMAREMISLNGVANKRDELAREGRTVVVVAVDGRASAVIGISDAPRSTAKAAVEALRQQGIEVATAITIGRATLRKMRQNLAWAVGYNAIAIPIAAGIFEPRFGLVLRPEIAALAMSGSSLLVAVNALLLKRLRLPAETRG